MSIATVPTLVVPLQKTLGPDTESRYKAITDTKSVVEFLDKSRSATSRTNTTSTAPAPALAPATIAFSEASSRIIDEILHSEGGSPNTLLYMNARDDASLQALAKALVPFLASRQHALESYLSEAESGTTPISEKTKAFWKEKKDATGNLLDIMLQADKTGAQLNETEKLARDGYFKNAKTVWEVELQDNLLKLNAEIVGPYSLGDQISIADLHLAAWLARIVVLSGGRINEEGDVVVTRVESHIGSGIQFTRGFAALPATGGAPRQDGGHPAYQSKLAVFWDAMRERSSFRKVYANGLY